MLRNVGFKCSFEDTMGTRGQSPAAGKYFEYFDTKITRLYATILAI